MPSLLKTYNNCGKDTCICQTGYLHGPYYFVKYYLKSRTNPNDGEFKKRDIGKKNKVVPFLTNQIKNLDINFEKLDKFLESSSIQPKDIQILKKILERNTDVNLDPLKESIAKLKPIDNQTQSLEIPYVAKNIKKDDKKKSNLTIGN